MTYIFTSAFLSFNLICILDILTGTTISILQLSQHLASTFMFTGQGSFGHSLTVLPHKQHTNSSILYLISCHYIKDIGFIFLCCHIEVICVYTCFLSNYHEHFSCQGISIFKGINAGICMTRCSYNM